MKKMIPVLAVLAVFVLLAVVFLVWFSGKDDGTEEAALSSEGTTLILELSTGGPVVIEMFPDKAPNHVQRFKTLANQGFYDGVVFHRVLEGFMAQTGDPTGQGDGSSELPDLQAEFNDVMHTRGIVSTARTADPNSANSQFFIMFGDAPQLDGQYTVWGVVMEGMEYVDAIQRGPRENNGIVPLEERDRIITARVAGDEDD